MKLGLAEDAHDSLRLFVVFSESFIREGYFIMDKMHSVNYAKTQRDIS